MPLPDPELRDRIRQQFDHCPYPNIPIEVSHAQNPNLLYIHNLVTPYYRRYQQVPSPAGKVILDAGCGTGLKALALAQANPGARIIGIDLSPESVEFAAKRLQYHGFDNCEFHALSIEELPQQDWRFDYINCDEVLYLLPDPLLGLQAMRAVLQPEGILRANLHSFYGRHYMLCLQQVFAKLGLFEQNPGAEEVQIVHDTMAALRDDVLVKRAAWQPPVQLEDKESILSNALLVGDKGYTVPQFFEFLQAADLEFIALTNPLAWDFRNLFKEPDNPPVIWGLALTEATEAELLALHELLHPVNRLIDLWCGCAGPTPPITPLEDWTADQWHQATVHLHPQLATPGLEAALAESINCLHPLELHHFLSQAGQARLVDSTVAACLLQPLLAGPQSFAALVARWQQLRPVNPLTLAPVSPGAVAALLQDAITGLAVSGYLLVTG